MIMNFADNEHLMLQLACDTFRALQGLDTNSAEYDRMSKRWDDEKFAVLWLVLSRFIDEPSV